MDSAQNTKVNPSVARKLPYSFANSKGVIAAAEHEGAIELWLREGSEDPTALAEARRVLGRPLSVRKVSLGKFAEALSEAYAKGGDTSYQMVIEDIEVDKSLQSYIQELPKISDLLESGDDAPIIRLVNDILSQALREKASDIHFELFETRSTVRFRVDGVLRNILELNPGWHAAIVSRLKIMANLDIDVKRLPQDSRISLKLAGHPIDVRVSTLPTAHGERVVLRLLDKEEKLLTLDKLGMGLENTRKIDELVKQPHGIVLVTGPTGSGKTTTLYAALNRLDMGEKNIMTVEDPIEYNLEGVSQTQVNPKIEMSFARALRSILRQDPDVVMIGEIRDLETARIAVQASLTGHLVLATLHTNDSVGAVTRLIDMGVEPLLLSSSLLAIVAQRLLRRVCPHCLGKDEKTSSQALLEAGVEKEEVPDFTLFRGRGCDSCGGSGYEGRIGVFEMLVATQTVKEAINSRVPESQLRKIAMKEGMKILRRDALEKARRGLTTLDEVTNKTTLVKEALPAYLLNPDELSFDDGELIIKENNTDKNFYQLIRGELVIVKDDSVVGKITQPGEYFGEIAALLDQPRSATIRSKGKSIVKVFPGEKLKQTLDNYPDISLNIIQSLINHLNEATRTIIKQRESGGAPEEETGHDKD